MALIDLTLDIDRADIPGDVRSFIREAERRIQRFRHDSSIHGFVPSDSISVYAVLRSLAAADLAPGNLFCEWGSGFGVAACLAAMVGFDACGIEIEVELIEAARLLADDFELPVEFAHGSFVPKGGQVYSKSDDGFAWLTTDETDTHDDLGLDTNDFDVVFAYPWPDEERVTADLFDRFGRDGAVLVTYHGGEDFRLRRKKSRRRKDEA